MREDRAVLPKRLKRGILRPAMGASSISARCSQRPVLIFEMELRPAAPRVDGRA